MPSGLDFESCSSVVHYCLIICFKSIKLRTALSWLSAELLERLPAPPPLADLWGDPPMDTLSQDYSTLYLLDVGIWLVPTSLRLTLRNYVSRISSRSKKCVSCNSVHGMVCRLGHHVPLPVLFCNQFAYTLHLRTSTLAQITGNALIAVPYVFVTMPRKIWWYTFDILKETMLNYIECKKCKGGCLNRSHGLLVQLLYSLTRTVIRIFFFLLIYTLKLCM